MADTKLGYRIWAIAMFVLTTGLKGVSSMKLHRDLGISRKSAWHLVHRIRACWERDEDLLRGPRGSGRDLRRRQGAQKAREQGGPCRARGTAPRTKCPPARRRARRSATCQGFVRGRSRPGRAGPLRRGAGLRWHGGVPARGRQALRRRVRARGSAYERHRVVPVPVQVRPLRDLSPDVRPSSRALPHEVRGTAQSPQLRHSGMDAAHGVGPGRQDADLPATGWHGCGHGPSTALPVRCGLSSRSVQRALRIRNPPPRPVSSPDNSYRQPAWKGSLSTANRVPPGHARRCL